MAPQTYPPEAASSVDDAAEALAVVGAHVAATCEALLAAGTVLHNASEAVCAGARVGEVLADARDLLTDLAAMHSRAQVVGGRARGPLLWAQGRCLAEALVRICGFCPGVWLAHRARLLFRR